MAIGRVAFRTHSRRQGHTAAAALAYRHGVNLLDRHGHAHDYRRRARSDEVLATGLSAPRRWVHGDDLQELANRIESAERRRDSRICRDVQIALPHELPQDAQTELVEQYADWLQERYDTPVAWAMHAPDADHDQRNVHAHLVLPSRTLGDEGDAFGAKLRELDCPGTAGDHVTDARNAWADFANEALKRAGIDASVNVGQCLPEGGHARYARAATTVTRRLPSRAKSLLSDVRRLLTNRPDGDGGLLASQIFLSARQYWALAYARVPVPQWAQPKIQPSPGMGEAIRDLIELWRGPKRPKASQQVAPRARPRKIRTGNAPAVWGAAIENPPVTLDVGDLIEIETRRGRLRSAAIAEIESRTRDLALVRTGAQAEILLRATRSSGEVVEVRREADRSLTFSDHGQFGHVRSGTITLAESRVGDALAEELGGRTWPVHKVVQRMAAALTNDGARIEYSAAPNLCPAAPAAIADDPMPARPRERGRRRRRRRRRPQQAPTYDAQWAVESMRETSRQQAESESDAPTH